MNLVSPKFGELFVVWRIILNLVSPENKSLFRRLENFEKNKVSNQLHREFNQICLKENLLPKYTNIHILYM